MLLYIGVARVGPEQRVYNLARVYLQVSKVLNPDMWYLKRDGETCLLKLWHMDVDNKLVETSPMTDNEERLVEVLNVKSCKRESTEVEVCYT